MPRGTMTWTLPVENINGETRYSGGDSILLEREPEGGAQGRRIGITPVDEHGERCRHTLWVDPAELAEAVDALTG